MGQVYSHDDTQPDRGPRSAPEPDTSLRSNTAAGPVPCGRLDLPNGGSGSHLSLAPAPCSGPGSGIRHIGGSVSGSGSVCGAGSRSGGWCCSLVSAFCRLVSFVVDARCSEKRRDSDPAAQTDRLLDTDVSLDLSWATWPQLDLSGKHWYWYKNNFPPLAIQSKAGWHPYGFME